MTWSVCLKPAEEWGTFAELMVDRSGFQRDFCRRLASETGLKGKVLDIGCGGNLPSPLEGLKPLFGELDGVDPDEAVMRHPFLSRRWHGRLEDCDIPRNEYDLAYAYNVVEHVADPAPFLEKVHGLLKPGGVFWALTPHARHPFCATARLVERCGGKGRMREQLRQANGGYTVNAFPSYYRLNSRSAVLKTIRGLGFSSATFRHFPCLQWDTYFPSALRWAPHWYDRVLGCRFPGSMLIFMFRLEK